MEKFFLRAIRRVSENPLSSLLIVALLTIIAFSNIFQNKFVLDDFDFIVNWPLIQDLRNIPYFFINYVTPPGQDGIYSPLKTFIHAINFNLFGLNPFGYHIFSIGIHLLGTFFTYRIIFLLTDNRLIAFLGSLFFGVHPIHANIITNMTGSVDAAGIVFGFISFYFYIQAHLRKVYFSNRDYILSLAFALISIFTHELMISLPILFLWYEFCFYRNKYSTKEILFRIMPLFGIVFFYVLAKYIVLGAITRGRYINDSFYLTMLVIIKAWAKYVIITIFPFRLTHNHIISKGIFSYDPDDFDKFEVLSQSIFDPYIIGSLCVIGIIFYIAYKDFHRKPLITFCIGWFFICLLPVSNFIPSGVYFAERYLYPGSLTFCLLLASSFQYLSRSRFQYLFSAFLIMLTVFYTGRTWTRNLDFRNEIALFESVVSSNPQSAGMRNDLGIVYIENGLYDQAIKSIQTAIAIKPNDPEFYISLADAYIGKEEGQKAIAALSKAVMLDPEFAEAYYNLASVYAFSNDVDKAKENLSLSIKYLKKKGRYEDVIEYQKAFYSYFGPNYVINPL